MNNLPISPSNAQAQGGPINAVLPGSGLDALAQASPAELPFAKLLARQMADTEPSVADAAAIIEAIAVDGEAVSMDAAENMGIADIANNPAAALAALLVQLPGYKTGSGATTPESGYTSASVSIQVSGIGLTSVPGSTQASSGRVMPGLTGHETAHPKPAPVEDFSLPQSGDITSETSSVRTTSALVDDSTLNLTQSDTVKPLDRFALANLPSSSNSNSTQQPASSLPMAVMSPGDPIGNNAVSGIQRAIAAPMGSNAWADDFSQSINWLVTQNNQIAELRLNPPDLGPLNVVLKVSDNHATLLFTSPHGSVRDAVENALPKLREILADNGIMLGNATVSDQSLSDRGAQTFAAQNHSPNAQHSATDENLLPAAPITPMRRHNGMVDTFA